MAEPRMEFTARVGSILRGLLPRCWVAESGSRSLGGVISMSTSGSYSGTILRRDHTACPENCPPPIVQYTRIRLVDYKFLFITIAYTVQLLIFYDIHVSFTINHNLFHL